MARILEQSQGLWGDRLTQKRSFNRKYVVDELNRLASKVSTQMSLFVIGGLALIHFGLKEATKDIDVVVQSTDEFNDLTSSLTSLGYSPPSPFEITAAYRKWEPAKSWKTKMDSDGTYFIIRSVEPLSSQATWHLEQPTSTTRAH